MDPCTHMTITFIGEQIECKDCHDHPETLQVSNQELGKLLKMLQEVLKGLEDGGLNDTAQVVREALGKLVISKQLIWSP